MSKETHLKGEKKQKVIDLIKLGMALRLRNEEILDQLKAKGFEISERTLRRYKLDIHEESGSSLEEKFNNQVVGNIIEDMLSYQEMQRQCWRLYYDAQTINEKIRALSSLRSISLDKIKILNNVPKGYRHEKINYKEIRERMKDMDEQAKEVFEYVKKQGINPKASFAENLQKQNEKILAAVKIRRTK